MTLIAVLLALILLTMWIGRDGIATLFGWLIGIALVIGLVAGGIGLISLIEIEQSGQELMASIAGGVAGILIAGYFGYLAYNLGLAIWITCRGIWRLFQPKETIEPAS